MAASRQPTWTHRAAELSEALQALLEASVASAKNSDEAAARGLNTCAVRFDNVASSLEQDLLALASANPSPPRTAPFKLLRSLAGSEEAAAASSSGRPTKRARTREIGVCQSV